MRQAMAEQKRLPSMTKS